MTERYGSTRKHKKHRASHKVAGNSSGVIVGNSSAESSLQEPPPSTSTSNGGISSNEIIVESSSSSTTGNPVTPNRQQPIRMVLKLAQSGAYSPAHADLNSASSSADGSSNGQPPTLLPLHSDGYGNDLYSNGSFRRSKKKKKKHHHHHHHHHHREGRHGGTADQSLNITNSSMSTPGDTVTPLNELSNTANDAFFDGNSNLSDAADAGPTTFSGHAMNATLNSLVRGSSNADFDDEVDEDEDDELGNGLHKASNKNILNLIHSELMLDSPHDSIASVDLMDVDSNNLDISCLQATGDSPADDDDNSPEPGQTSQPNKEDHHRFGQLGTTTTSTGNNNNSLSSKASLYRRLLQHGINIDSNNVVLYCQTVGCRATTKKAKAWVKFASELLRRLREKDQKHFFAWPTTDLMAPGYSMVVGNPIDFATIEKKIQFCLYRSIYEMKLDVRVLCENALRFYRSSGAQYKEAARLWTFAKRDVFTRDVFTVLIKQCPPLTMDDLGLEQLIGEEVKSKKRKRKGKTATVPLAVNGFSGLKSLINSSDKTVVKKEVEEIENGEDDDDENESASTEEPLSREEILLTAAKAIGQESMKLEEAEAKWSLVDRRPKLSTIKKDISSKLYSRFRPDGSTSLPFVLGHPSAETAFEDDPEAPNTLGAFVGRLTEGSRSVPMPKEAEYNRVKVMQLVPEALANPFSSHLPLIDCASGGGGAGTGGGVLSLEDSSLLLNEFGSCDEQFRETILRISEDADYMIGYVDSVLNIVTGGKYSKEVQQLSDPTITNGDDQQPSTSTSTATAEVAEVPMEVDSTLTSESTQKEEKPLNEENLKDEQPKSEQEQSTENEVENATSTAAIDTTESPEEEDSQTQLQLQLDETKALISQLETLQYKRMCSAPEPVPPDARETELAEKVTSKLVAMIATATRPADVISLQAIRRSMGILVPQLEEEVVTIEDDEQLARQDNQLQSQSSVNV